MTDTTLPFRVLLLEDSAFDAELLGETLRATRPEAQLRWVTGRDDFLSELDGGTWDVVLSDHELPGFSGLDALEAVRARSPSLPFIFVSGVIGEDNAVEMLKRGATDYVSKSRLARLPVVIDRALRESAALAARSLAEARLQEADLRYAGVVDALPDYAVLLLDRDGRVLAWNRAATGIFGHTREAMIGRSASVLFLPEEAARGAFDAELTEALAAGKAEVSGWRQRADGSRLRADGICTPLYAADGTHAGFCKLVHDATAAYERAEALRAAKEEAERASLAKDRFLAMLSHELRTPLTPIAAAAHVLERFAQVPDRHRDLLPMIRRNVALESRLIDDLLDLTTVAAGKLRLQRAPVDVHALLQRAVDMLGSSPADKSQTLALDLAAQAHVVDADEARLVQVLSNIVRNAVKFTPDGGRIVLRTSDEEGRFVFRCIDTGIGIEPEALPHIFSAFEQAGEGLTRRFGGLGLGLAIAAGLVHEHGGTLTAESAGRDQGAVFTLTLEPLGGGLQALPSQDAAPPPAEGAGRRLLLVEDNADAADALRTALEDHGYHVTHAATCAAALAVAEVQAFDAVVTDLGLPDGSGVAIGRALSPRLPVIALSGYGAPSDRQACDEAGILALVVKPADPEQLQRVLARVLAGR